MNVIDDDKLQSALGGVTDQALQGLTHEVIPVAGALINSTLANLTEAIEASLGNALSALTAEREEAIGDLHRLLDRLNGATVTLAIPPR